jgi:acyl-CoA thioester hydrolase
VYWEDTDAGGIVFYANYLKFFERARTEWFRQLGFSQEALRHDPGVMFVVTDTSVRHHAPARLDDWLEVSVAVQRMGAASLEIRQEARAAQRLVAHGTIRIGCVDAATLKPCRLPAAVAHAVLQPAVPPGGPGVPAAPSAYYPTV